MWGQRFTFYHWHPHVHSHIINHFSGHVNIIPVIMVTMGHHRGRWWKRLVVMMMHCLLELFFHHLSVRESNHFSNIDIVPKNVLKRLIHLMNFTLGK
jgi:hypothetical protein